MIGKDNKCEIKRVREIKKELLINGGDLDLYLDLFITDENGEKKKVLTKKGDSLTANFLRVLYLQMGRNVNDNSMGGTFYKINNASFYTIKSVTAGAVGKFRIEFTSSCVYAVSGKVALGGLQGIELEGIFDFTRIDDYRLDVIGTAFTTGWVTGTGAGYVYIPVTNMGYASEYSFQSNGIRIGTGNLPTTIDSFTLEKPIPSNSSNGGLTYNANTVSQDTNDSTSAQITFTRTFTNNTSISTNVKEIALYMLIDGNSSLMVMRDIIEAGIDVGVGKTLTINYRIKTTLNSGTDPGGFIANFMRILYRHIAQVNRAAFDINNVSITAKEGQATFMAVKCGGDCIEYKPLNYENEKGWKTGIVVGSGENAVSMGDYNLQTLTQHGKSTGQMLYYGGFSEDFEVGTDYAQFSLIKAIENNSGDSITVNEIGLICGASNNTSGSGDNYAHPKYLFLIARNLLTTPIAVENQEILKVTYTIKLIVEGESS